MSSVELPILHSEPPTRGREYSREPGSPPAKHLAGQGPDDFSDTRGREVHSPRDLNRVTSIGIGGAGNIRSPSRDGSRWAKVDEADLEHERGRIATNGSPNGPASFPQSAGRGGAGNFTRAESKSTSRSRSKGPVLSMGRGGAGNTRPADQAEAQILEVDDEERAAHSAPAQTHLTGRGGKGNAAAGGMPLVELASRTPDSGSSGRGGAGNIRPRSTSRGPGSSSGSKERGGLSGLLQRVARSGSRSKTRDETDAERGPGLTPLINEANAYLSSGQFNDAVKAYSDAIELAPTDYALYYKRATAYFSLSRHANAMSDFEQVLNLTSDTFDKAHFMKARIHAKEGRWSDARDSLKRYQAKQKSDKAAAELLLNVSDGEMAAKKVQQAQRAKLWTACEEAATNALRVASHSVHLRQQRANCALAAGDFEEAVGDMTRLTHITSPSTSAYMNIFRISYFYMPTTAATTAMSNLKQCLHYDPDSKPCLTAHRLVKKLDKSFTKLDMLMGAEDWRGIVSLILGSKPSEASPSSPGEGLLATLEGSLEPHASPALFNLPSGIPMPPPHRYSPRRQELLRALCRSYVQMGQARTGEKWCDELLSMLGSDKDIDGLIGKGEALLVREEWEEAVRAFELAWEASGGGNRDIHARLSKAQRLLKQSRQKDYYKVLGVSRDADAKTIKKAYRKATLKAHPDKGGSETKMATVNEAYEVLSNPELRQRFDNGDDPNDPMAQQGGPFPGGGGGHPFAQFFQQGGSGFQFAQGGGGGGGFQFHFAGRH
ncbi:TPR-like protein [Auriscalpium vulgare]|uniref:TPR-like protein n=1 Tax=Auriscalpium vulgare TaxID=40419 RepID=A0ACB8S5S3_9AGAM|nr:TPR-like protein [Auriscalpium vulgare]